MKPMPHARRHALGLALVLAAVPAWAQDPHAGHGAAAEQQSQGPEPRGSLPVQPAAADAMDHAHHHGPAPSSGADHPDGHAPGGEAPASAVPGAVRGPVLPPPSAEEVRAAFPDLGPHAHMKAPLYTLALADRLEAQDAGDATALVWDARFSVGNDLDRLVVSSEGERLHGDTGEARHEAYWRHAWSRWWERRLGLRHDAGEGPGRDWLGVGIEGLAPYFIELSATAYLGEEGRSAFTLEAEYDLRITNRLILQPRVELNAYGRDDAARELGSGLADSEAGLRLRYEVRREFAPYVGVEWSRLHGETASLAAAAGAGTGEARAVAGLRLWY